MPLALAAFSHGDAVLGELERQLRNPNTSRMDGRFAFRTGVPERLAAGLSTAEAKLYATIGATPLPLDRLLASTAQNATLARLVARGLVHVAGFTPSDAAHVLGRQVQLERGRRAARRRAVRAQARRPRPAGRAVARGDLGAGAHHADAHFGRSDPRDGLRRGRARWRRTVAHALVQRAVDGRDGIARLSVALDRPVIGLGASAPLHYEGLPPLVGNRCMVPEHTDVANALGAVVGQVRVSAEALVSQPREGLFRLNAGETMRDFTDEATALAAAEASVRHRRRARAGRRHRYSGDRDRQPGPDRHRRGPAQLHRSQIIATAAGRPRIAT